VVRVFTRGPEGGNHLGVVTDVSGLSERVMQEVAADLGFSETVFVDWRDGGVPIVRIFTPARELPFAGHPLVGASWVLNMLGPGGVDAIRCAVGDCATRVSGDVVSVAAPRVDRFVRSCPIDVTGWVTAVDAVTVAMPLEYHVLQVATPAEVAAVGPPDLSQEVYLWAEAGDDTVKARFFAPEMGVVEDPATGSAAVALATVLTSRGRSSGHIEIHQGDEIDAPSTIHLTWDGLHIEVAGTVVKDEVRELDV
jgi:trans-2,3-dihydro-3-hydroxyanthranilate isomerase